MSRKRQCQSIYIEELVHPQGAPATWKVSSMMNSTAWSTCKRRDHILQFASNACTKHQRWEVQITYPVGPFVPLWKQVEEQLDKL